jgi:large subunit ribosomal protein L2
MNKKFFIDRVKKNLIIGFTKRAGRNFFGRKTILTQSGGYFRKLRAIDFKRVLHLNSILLLVEKDIYRTGFLGLICYENGLYSYILLFSNFKIGSILKGFTNNIYLNTATFLFNMYNGNFVHNIEFRPGEGAKLTRAAGCSSFIVSQDDKFSYIKMNSGWLLKISKFCTVVNGMVSNENHHLINIKSAGKNRKLGIRPKVRGVAMNPCDHPHGGGEGTGSPPAAHKTPKGKMTKVPTIRNKKYLLKKKIYKNIVK